jgi:hypothetical protein
MGWWVKIFPGLDELTKKGYVGRRRFARTMMLSYGQAIPFFFNEDSHSEKYRRGPGKFRRWSEQQFKNEAAASPQFFLQRDAVFIDFGNANTAGATVVEWMVDDEGKLLGAKSIPWLVPDRRVKEETGANRAKDYRRVYTCEVTLQLRARVGELRKQFNTTLNEEDHQTYLACLQEMHVSESREGVDKQGLGSPCSESWLRRKKNIFFERVWKELLILCPKYRADRSLLPVLFFGGAKFNCTGLANQLQDFLAKKSHTVMIGEHRTSQCCPLCLGQMDLTYEMPRDRWRMKRCEACKCTFNRDTSAPCNFTRIAMLYLLGHERPRQLQKNSQ